MHESTKTASVIARDKALIADALKIRYTPFALSHGEGARLFDLDGREFIDFGGAWSVAGLGYSNAHVREAIKRQIDTSTCGILISGMHEPALELAERLVELAPGDFEKKVWYGLAGSDASEAAQRMLLRATGRPRIVSFIGSWHGTTDAAMGLSAHPSLAGVGGGHVTKIPYPNPYRDPLSGNGENLTDRCLDYLEKYLFTTICPPDQVAAIFVEAVQADGGDIVPPADFLPKLRALCDRHGILLVLDEIKVGLGRTGAWFAFEHDAIHADLILLGKSLGGGMPLSAVVGRREILDAEPGMAMFTMVGNVTSCAAGVAVLDEIERLELLPRATIAGERFLEGLRVALGSFPCVGDIRGKGLILGVELVQDKATKEPETTLPAKIVYRAWELGLILYYAGMWGNTIEFTPPLVIDDGEIDQGIDILRRSFEDVLDGAVSDEKVAEFAGW